MIRKVRALCTACFVAPLVIGSAWGCSAGGKSNDDDDGSAGQPGLPELPGGGDGFIGGGPGGDQFGPGASSNNGCNQLQVAFESTTPTALIVVDRSSSQWDGEPNHNWEPVKDGLIDVIAKVQDKINIGLVTYTGQNGGACPDLQPALAQVTFAKNNLEPIRAALEAVQKPSFKGETPTAAAINQSVPVLLAAAGTGEKFILLVTDGDPDFCNDGDQVCPMDAVVAAVQNAKAQGIGTTVFGLQRTGVALSGEHLKDVANAGAGLPVRQPIQRLEDFQGRCQGPALGTYAATGGNATPFLANATDRDALSAALDQVVAGIRSCTFELAGSVKVDLARASQAMIQIDQNAPLTYDDANGWRMATETQVEILGSSCALLKSTQTRGINFDFPCEIVSPR
jgi:von Willebrand factor type A domain-containing protein